MCLLSIIIPVYNAEKTIGRTIESLNKIAEDSKKLIEVIIVNDGSQDKTMDIIDAKKNSISSTKFKIIKQKNQGTAAARNTALKSSQGEWIFFLDADDQLGFDPIPFVKKQKSNLSSLGFSVKYYQGIRCRKIKCPTLINLRSHLNILTSKNAVIVSSLIFKKDRINSLFDTDFIYMEDWLFWIMNPIIFENMKIFPKTTSAFIHAHGANKSSNYILNGKYREKVADKVLMNFNDKLTRKQKNNLRIQAKIGLIQQGKKAGLGAFLEFPCNIVLYTKLIIFFLLKAHFARFDLYGNRK